MGTNTNRQNIVPGKPKAEAKVFAITRQEAQATLDVVIGTLSIFDHDVYILINTGSTHSYLSLVFSMHASKKLSWLDYSLVVLCQYGSHLW